MARYTGAVCRLCRRENQKLFLKGDRCYTGKCAIARREYLPGQHGKGRKKVSEYGLQLRAKQKAKRYYGVLESQFKKYFEIAERKPGMTGENLLRILESRIDNVIYRLGLANSRAQARQFVTHNHYAINGKKINIPSILLKDGDKISVLSKYAGDENYKTLIEASSSRPVPGWLSMDRAKLEASVINLPNREDIDLNVEEHLIVELYSK